MIEKNQIEELEKLIVKVFADDYNQGCDPDAETTAKAVYEAGWRKQSEVAKEIFEEIEKLTARVYNDFMFNRERVGMNATNVVIFSDELDIAIAELKKKYTEGENK